LCAAGLLAAGADVAAGVAVGVGVGVAANALKAPETAKTEVPISTPPTACLKKGDLNFIVGTSWLRWPLANGSRGWADRRPWPLLGRW